MNFILNNENVSVELNPAVTVLDYLRNQKKLTGTKEGCREGDCGACTVLAGTIVKNKLQYKSVNSCLMPLADLIGKHLVTIEGLNQKELNVIQENFIEEGGTQCGFCTPGFIMSITNYFINNSVYDIQKAIDSLDGNICRCTGYEGIKRAVGNVISSIQRVDRKDQTNIDFLIEAGILPEYFLTIRKRLQRINKEIADAGKPRRNKKIDFLISGGTDLYVQKWETLYRSDVNFIYGKDELSQIKKVGKNIFIGGAVTVEQFGSSEIILKHFPQMEECIKYFGSLPIRNRATIAGNIVNASPIADIANILLALNASVIIKSKKKKRVVPLKEFFIAYKKVDLNPGEIVEAVTLETPAKDFYFNYEKVSRRTYLDIASVNSSIFIETKNDAITKVHLSAGGIAPIPLYLKKTSLFLKGKKINPEIILQACNTALTEISPISDARGSRQYKSLLLRQLIIAHFLKLFPELNEAGILI